MAGNIPYCSGDLKNEKFKNLHNLTLSTITLYSNKEENSVSFIKLLELTDELIILKDKLKEIQQRTEENMKNLKTKQDENNQIKILLKDLEDKYDEQ